MAVEFSGLEITLPSVANTAITQFAALTLAATGVSHTTGNTVVTTGFAQEGFAQLGAGIQAQVPVRIQGTTKAISSGAIAPGVFTTPTAAGLVIANAADITTINGISLNRANTANNDIFPLLIVQSRRS